MKAVVLSLVTLLFTTAVWGEDIIHMVTKGETLSLVSLNYTGSSRKTDSIARYNRIRKPDKISQGTLVKIPREIYAPLDEYRVPAGLSHKDYFQLGITAARRKNYFKAAGYFHASQLKKSNSSALYNSVLAAYLQGKYGQALEYAGDGNGNCAVLKALSLFALGKISEFEEAVSQIGPEAKKTDPGMLSVLYELTGNKVKAAALSSLAGEAE